MRKLFIVLASLSIILGIILTILPIEKLAVIPIGIGFVLAFLALRKSSINQKRMPKLLLLIAFIALIAAFGRTFLIKNEVVVDKKDEIQKIESQKEDKKILEELDGL